MQYQKSGVPRCSFKATASSTGTEDASNHKQLTCAQGSPASVGERQCIHLQSRHEGSGKVLLRGLAQLGKMRVGSVPWRSSTQMCLPDVARWEHSGQDAVDVRVLARCPHSLCGITVPCNVSAKFSCSHPRAHSTETSRALTLAWSGSLNPFHSGRGTRAPCRLTSIQHLTPTFSSVVMNP